MYTREELEKVTKPTFSRGSGPGGQHRNKVETRVRLTHIPTGIKVTVDEERSQARNLQIAYKRLAEKIEKEETLEVPRVETGVPPREKRKRRAAKQRRSQTIQARRSLDEE